MPSGPGTRVWLHVSRHCQYIRRREGEPQFATKQTTPENAFKVFLLFSAIEFLFFNLEEFFLYQIEACNTLSTAAIIKINKLSTFINDR